MDHNHDVERLRELPFSVLIDGKVIGSPYHPDTPEDTLIKNVQKHFIIGCDGMGGHAAGDKASQTTGQAVATELCKTGDSATISETVNAIRRGIIQASDNIDLLHNNPDSLDADTTFVVARIVPATGGSEKKFLVHAHIGDSRVYVWRAKTGKLDTATTDHGLVQRLVENGMISSADAFTDSRRNIVTRSVGDVKGKLQQAQVKYNNTVTTNREEAEKELEEERRRIIPIGVTEINRGDVVFIFSDGIHDNIPPAEYMQAKGLETETTVQKVSPISHILSKFGIDISFDLKKTPRETFEFARLQSLETIIKEAIEKGKKQEYRGFAEYICEKARAFSLDSSHPEFSKPDDTLAAVMTLV